MNAPSGKVIVNSKLYEVTNVCIYVYILYVLV